MDEERSSAGVDYIEAGSPAPARKTALEAVRGSQQSGRRSGLLAAIAGPVVEEIRRTLSAIIDRRKRDAAERLGSVAKGLHQVSEDTEEKNRLVSRAAEAAAGKVRDLSETIRERPVEEIARSAGDYLRKRPLLVLGGGILVGFIVAKVVRSGALSRSGTGSETGTLPEGTGIH